MGERGGNVAEGELVKEEVKDKEKSDRVLKVFSEECVPLGAYVCTMMMTKIKSMATQKKRACVLVVVMRNRKGGVESGGQF